MEDDFQDFLHNQFSEAHNQQRTPKELAQELLEHKERYGSKELFAEGGQKKIFKCTDQLTGRSIAYALARVPEQKENLEKFIREARVTAHLEHPHIIPVYDSGLNDKGLPFFTMKLISGENLGEHLKHNNNLNELIDILIKVCEALQFAHSKGIIHFDIKPENIQVSHFGEVLICDWGLAGIAYESCSDELLSDELLQKIDINQSLDSLFKGTPGYAAPEMSKKNIRRTHLADIYSLGATLYQILTKEKPSPEPDLNLLKGPDALQAICRQALETSPDMRYQNASDLLEDLQSWRNGFATQAENATFLTQLKLLILRNRNVCLSLLLSTLVIILLTWVSINSIRQKERKASQLAEALQRADMERISLEKELAPKYLSNAYKAFEERNYESVRALCSHILRNEESQEARTLIGLSYLSQQKFKTALPWLHGDLLTLSQEFASKPPLSCSELISFISQLERNHRQTQMILYKNLLIEEFEKDLSIDEIKDLMVAEMLYKNPRVKQISLELKETPEGLIINLANNPQLREVWILQKFGPSYIKRLDLSYTPVSLNDIIDQLHIEELILDGWPRANFQFLNGRRLLHLSVANSKADFSEFIKGMPLVSLNIKNSPFKDWQQLINLKFLKSLTVAKGQLPPQIKSQLRTDIKIIEQ